MNEVLFRADNQSELEVVDVSKSSNSIVVPDVRRLKRHVLQERHRSASHDSISGPPPISAITAVVKSFKAGERLPDVAINHEGMRNRNFLAIAVDVTGLKKPPDIHVAVGDLEFANGELHRPVNSKLVLLEGVKEACRSFGDCIETTWGNLVIEVAGSNGEILRYPNRDVHLRHRHCHFAVVEAVDV